MIYLVHRTLVSKIFPLLIRKYVNPVIDPKIGPLRDAFRLHVYSEPLKIYVIGAKVLSMALLACGVGICWIERNEFTLFQGTMILGVASVYPILIHKLMISVTVLDTYLVLPKSAKLGKVYRMPITKLADDAVIQFETLGWLGLRKKTRVSLENLKPIKPNWYSNKWRNLQTIEGPKRYFMITKNEKMPPLMRQFWKKVTQQTPIKDMSTK
ncbi:hypothetical protein NEOLI_000126 [Neolecta irregularis DAH-3]|uniref:Uncharacterized protein n=1 Tax=Neolecta irregularis (strain DAH-3) TaxID=1198029 RepID=A0A1U7LQS0_NEOID|nr:hypothetical protein NEOLI_000126 [Neolecta irregularis DAH-3]|eukprot:OLL25020.1 hypothetical protein NEOLI_000126 [Neolecta irregularis DAH-3]